MYQLWKEQKSMPEKNVKLTLRFETEDGETLEKVIEGAGKIEYALGEGGLLDNEIKEFLGY